MCYINGVRVTHAEFISYKQQEKELRQLMEGSQLREIRKGFDYTQWPVIKPSADGKDWDLVLMEWGFIPSYLKTRAEVAKFRNGYVGPDGKWVKGYTTLNFVGEELMEKFMYKEAALKRRCLVLSTGFLEHQHIEVMGKRGKPLKTPEKFPYYITVKDRPYFFFLGIYNTWTDQETGETVDTVSFGTTEANSLMRQIHNSKNRMPVIPPIELAEEWTDPNLSPRRIIELTSYQIPSREMQAHMVPKNFLELDDPTVPCKDERVPDLIYDENEI
ncbi:MAG: response-associated peptidase [Ferruginibacter sp.]|uniref:SOS response-associated peptidase n=1 Tax=Ferruginibacter sp. TaxID=1940288 RepID=UPI00265B6FBA|nr:SOS response-associated peptidase family protein [Ferruginibacter sp.]MDB5276137.1 response-associated peptidase [Ferruginibacter sp.]